MSFYHSSSVKMKPLMLKDFLREDCNFDSTAFGFLAFSRRAPETTVRYLLEVELMKNGKISSRKELLVNRSVRNNLLSNKLSAILNAVRSFPFKSSPSSSSSSSSFSSPPSDPKHGSKILSRNFPRKFLRRSFWKKRLSEDTSVQIESTGTVVGRNKVLVRDIISLGSFTDEARGGKPIDIPLISGRNSFSGSSSGWSECGRKSTSSSGTDSVPSPSSPVSSEFIKSGSSKPANLTDNDVVNSNPNGPASGDSKVTSNGCGDLKEDESENTECNCLRYEEKEQFSPVSVMDFLYDEEEEMDEEEPTESVATPPSSFHQTLVKLDNARRHFLQKSRRFQDIALLVSTDLNDSLDSASRHDTEEEQEIESEEVVEIARELLEKLKSTLDFQFDWNNDLDCIDNLLLDFFVEGLSNHKCKTTPTLPGEDRNVEDELMCVARNWIEGSGGVVENEFEVKEMEKDKRWRCFVHVEETDVVAADLEFEVFSSLMDEVLLDLVKDGGNRKATPKKIEKN